MEAIKCMSNAIDNGIPDLALLEIRRVAPIVDDWESKHDYISNEAYDCMGRAALP
jgi:hypothetical protein